jgi:hypothetical protein
VDAVIYTLVGRGRDTSTDGNEGTGNERTGDKEQGVENRGQEGEGGDWRYATGTISERFITWDERGGKRFERREVDHFDLAKGGLKLYR